MSEIGGLLLLVAGLVVLAGTGGLAACCLRLRSPIEFALAAYLIAWAWLVAVTLALSPARLVTRGWLLLAFAVGLAAALGVWFACDRPSPPRVSPRLSQAREAFRNPAVLVLGIAVALGTIYTTAIALLVPANEWDALAYHLTRAAFWKQQHGLGYVDGATDSRLDAFPPNAEIGQLATMLLAGSDRYVAAGQLLAYAALVLCVAGLARRIGLGVHETVFAALAFATLPVVVLEASGAINDLVVASFLAIAAFFALGAGVASLLLLAVAVALAIGTKFTGLFALPTLALVAAAGSPRHRWPALLLATVAGLALGSVWYVVNVVETGQLDGGSGYDLEQRQELEPAVVATTAMRLALSFLDMPGAPWPTSLIFLVPVALLAAVALLRVRHSRGQGIALLGAAALTAGVLAAPLVWDLGERAFFKAGLVLGTPGAVLADMHLALNTRADAGFAWYGPLGPLLLATGSVALLLAWRRWRRPALPLALAAAPWVLLATLAVTIAWDPFRGRFLVFGVALAAATWGFLLRSTVVAMATAAIGSTMLFFVLAAYEGKPSGLLAEPSIWGNPRWEAQARLEGPGDVLRFFETRVPEKSRVGISLRRDYPVHPFFGPELSRHVSFVGEDGPAPDTEWLVIDPQRPVPRCPGAWRLELVHQGFRIERRVAPDACLDG